MGWKTLKAGTVRALRAFAKAAVGSLSLEWVFKGKCRY